MAYTTIDDPSVYFQTKLWSGNGSAGTSITNDGNSDLQPDFFWAKVRNHTYNHIVLDSSRGVTNKRIIPNSTDAEDTYAGFMDSFDTDGFTVDNDVNTNESGKTYVAWQWKVNGGTTANNTSGDIGTSVVQANTTAGISIVLYTGNNTGGSTVGHGLGGVPEWILTKSRAAAKPWVVYHASLGNTKSIKLDTNDGAATDSSAWSNTTPSSTTFTLGNGDSNHTGTMVAYCFRSIQGYSKIGSYAGNGSTDGPFVYTGFKPAWVLIKRDAASSQWHLFDSTRNEFNVANKVLFPSTNEAEQSYTGSDPMIDILSNGFKMRSSYNQVNSSSGNYIYVCFAELPFVSSEGVPTTAR